MKKPRFGGGGDGRSSRDEAEREAQEELARLTRRAQAPPSAPPRSFSPRPGSAPPPTPRSFGPRPAANPSPGFGRPSALEEDLADEEYDEDDDDEEAYGGPRNAREEEELVTELALRDWAVGRGSIEDLARPRLDPSSVEVQRDRALRDVMERAERMQREYRDQKARLQPAGDSPEISETRAAHQMNVLRRGKPPGMMNMAAAQTGAFNRQRSARAAAAADAAEAAAALPAKRGKAAAKKKAPVEKGAVAKRSSARSAAAAPAGGKAKVAKKGPVAKAPVAKKAKATSAPRGTPAKAAPAAAKQATAESVPPRRSVAGKAQAASAKRSAAGAVKAPRPSPKTPRRG